MGKVEFAHFSSAILSFCNILSDLFAFRFLRCENEEGDLLPEIHPMTSIEKQTVGSLIGNWEVE